MKTNDREYTRKRPHCITFRVNQDERDLIYEKIKLSGQSKQDYIIEALLKHDVTFMGDRQVFQQLQSKLVEIENRLRNITEMNDIPLEDLEIMKLIRLILS